MTDWKRVERLRSQGVSWDKVAADGKAGFHAPPGANPGRALQAVYFSRRSKTGRTSASVDPDRSGGHARVGGPRRMRSILPGAVAVAVFVLVLYFVLTSGFHFGGPPKSGTSPGPGAAGTQVEFNYLSQQSSDACAWPGVNLGDETAYVSWVNGLPANTYIQGACCSPMDFNPDYTNQTIGLKAYASLSSLIPADHYNVLSQVAQADVAGEHLTLTANQQAILSSAGSQTNDGSWCCCQCWAYYAHEGLAKTLIVQYGYDVQQVVTVINLEDCCGGPGPMNMP